MPIPAAQLRTRLEQLAAHRDEYEQLKSPPAPFAVWKNSLACLIGRTPLEAGGTLATTKFDSLSAGERDSLQAEVECLERELQLLKSSEISPHQRWALLIYGVVLTVLMLGGIGSLWERPMRISTTAVQILAATPALPASPAPAAPPATPASPASPASPAPEAPPISPSRPIYLMVLMFGCLGGSLRLLSSVVMYIAKNRLVKSWIPYYVIMPLEGTVMGLLMFFLSSGGWLKGNEIATAGSDLNGLWLLATLGGLFAK
ncbi:MAG: hypothetical protein ACKOUR_01030, partial [Planctomycetota bacterium]